MELCTKDRVTCCVWRAREVEHSKSLRRKVKEKYSREGIINLMEARDLQ